ncbi:hypothetical protein Tco_1512836, partial [Tanacetum coccineum]
YGYIRNHKKMVKNGQARTRESEEYKKKPKIQSRSQKCQALSQNGQIMGYYSLINCLLKLSQAKRPRKAQVKPSFALISLSEEAHICHITDCHAGNPYVHICDLTGMIEKILGSKARSGSFTNWL